MKIDYDVALEIAAHEALVRQAYKDSKGIWTWSVGLTSATGHNVERYIGKPQPMRHCLAVFLWALERYAKDVREAFKGRDLTKEQFAAALSFHWNTGAIKRASWVKKWLAGDTVGARQAFMQWNKPAEITARRLKERDLFFYGKWSNDGKITEYTRVRPNGTPDWGSGKRIDIKDDLAAIFGGAAPTRPTEVPAEAKHRAPTTATGGVWAAISRVFSAIFRRT